MGPFNEAEFSALRATIRERGTVRVWVFWATIGAWAATTIAVAAATPLPVLALVPLLVLGAGFEAVHALHVGVERIGRYLQGFYERADSLEPPGWETAIAAFGRERPGAAPDPLFTVIFLLATVLNLIPVLIAEPVPLEVTVVGGVHALFVARITLARGRAASQRALDEETFARLRAQGAGPKAQSSRPQAEPEHD